MEERYVDMGERYVGMEERYVGMEMPAVFAERCFQQKKPHRHTPTTISTGHSLDVYVYV